MHTVWVRLNAVVFFGLSVIISLSGMAAVSKIYHPDKPIIHKLKLNKMRSLKSHGGVDRALLSFNIHADMNPTFHWNVKQIFVYVVANYKTDRNPKNHVVLWDKIIEATDADKVIEQSNVFVKYALVDQSDGLRGEDITLQLMWDHMPITGFMWMEEQDPKTRSKFTLPMDYQ